MKNLWVLLFCLLFLAGCAASETGRQERSYDLRLSNYGTTQTVTIYFSLDADVASKFDSGNAATEMTPTTALGMQGATGSATGPASKQALEGLKNVFTPKVDNSQKDSNNPVNTTAPAVQPQVQVPLKPPEEPAADTDTMSLDSYDVVATADCDQKMSYHHNDEIDSTDQVKCVFGKPGPEYGKSLLIVWSDGNKLEVPNSGSMTWVFNADKTGDARDFRKYQPYNGDTKDPATPCEVYAARGTSPKSASILIKK